MSLEAQDIDEISDIVQLIEEKKGDNLSVFDMRDHSISTSFFVVADGDNSRQVRAIANNVMESKKEELYHKDGLDGGSWIVLDYGEVMVHVFLRQTREFYDLDGLWADRSVAWKEHQLRN